MAKFDVSAAAGTAPQAEEKTTAAPKKAPAKKTAAPKKATPAKKPAAAKKPAPTKKAPVKAAPVAATMSARAVALEDLLEEVDEREQGLVQVGLRLPPQLKARMKTTMIRAGLKQERFIAAAIRSSLDELDALLDEREGG